MLTEMSMAVLKKETFTSCRITMIKGERTRCIDGVSNYEVRRIPRG